MGHFKFASRVIISQDLRFVFSVGELNGIYRWSFYGDKSMPDNIDMYCEEIEQEDVAQVAHEDDKEGALFEQDQLLTYT